MGQNDLKEDVSALEAAMGGVEEPEPLQSITDTLGWEKPEALSDDLKEPEPDMSKLNPYDRWKMTGSTEDLYAVTTSLKPTVNSVLASMGGARNPQLEAKARVITAKAVASYDPEAGASLPTWVSQQLRQMTRDVRKSNSPIHVPDGAQLDAYSIYRAEEEFKDENGREPTMQELSDKCKLSMKRIRDVRKKMRPVSAGNAKDEATGTTNEVAMDTYETDYSKDALDYVYNDSDNIDKKLLEYTTGYNGFDPLDSKEIMQRLKLSPVQLTRRKARLSLRMKDIIADLESLSSQ